MTQASLFRNTLLLLVASSTLGDEVALKPLKPVLELTKQFVSPPPFDTPLLHAPADAVPKNIILIIGDGMGQGALKLTSLHQHKVEGRLLMQQLPVAGFCTTRSASSDVTDSAAAATALATGCKTANGFLGITPDKQQQLTSFAEVAQRGGRAIGLITSDSIAGATPAGFYANEISRSSYQGVAEHAAASGFDVLIGNNNGKAWFMPKAAGGQRTDPRDVLNDMRASGYVVVTNQTSFAQAPRDKKILGFMDAKAILSTEQILGQLADTALERLAKNDKGFFLMVECATTDAGGHSNAPDMTVLGTTQVDWAVRSAVEFARTRGDTLVLVIADHETGGLTCGITNMPPGKLVVNYSSTHHTGAPVRLFAYGPGSHLFKDTIDNTDVAKNICRFWQLTLPAPIPFNVPEPKMTRYPDGRPGASFRLEAKDQGVVLKHGDGPQQCDTLGARDVWVYEDKGTYYMHYDGAGPKGWLCCLATSTNLVDWVKKGPVLDFGKPGEEDSKSASYGVTYFDGTSWHMYYLGTPHVSPAPDLIPSFPYLTMKAKGASAAGPWTKQPEVVPFRTKPGTYYSATASPGHIIKQGDNYLMFFSASTDKPVLRTLSIARTRDLNGPWTVDATPIVPLAEQIENSSLYFEPANQTWFLFTNHIGLEGGEYTDAVWVYWTKDLNTWNAADKAIVLDGRNCAWSRKCIGLPSVLKVGNRLAIIYDGPGGTSKSHMKRDVGLAWLELPLVPPSHPK